MRITEVSKANCQIVIIRVCIGKWGVDFLLVEFCGELLMNIVIHT